MAKAKWNDAGVRAFVLKGMERNMHRAVAHLEREVKKRLRIGQPRISLPGGWATGGDPSLPGESPHAFTGMLRNSIKRFVVRRSLRMIGQVGTASLVGKIMEKGSPGGEVIVPKRAKALIVPKRRSRSQAFLERRRRRRGKMLSGRKGTADVAFLSRVTRGAIAPRPFLRPAFLQNRNRLKMLLSAPLKR